jgi:hypothetical protein
MSQKSFITYLNDDLHVTVEFERIQGELVSFVVRLMLNIETESICIVRYDTAHGCPHRDMLNASGRLIEKHWLLGFSFSEALNYAIQDFKKNHETYFSQFKKRAAASLKNR